MNKKPAGTFRRMFCLHEAKQLLFCFSTCCMQILWIVLLFSQFEKSDQSSFKVFFAILCQK